MVVREADIRQASRKGPMKTWVVASQLQGFDVLSFLSKPRCNASRPRSQGSLSPPPVCPQLDTVSRHSWDNSCSNWPHLTCPPSFNSCHLKPCRGLSLTSSPNSVAYQYLLYNSSFMTRPLCGQSQLRQSMKKHMNRSTSGPTRTISRHAQCPPEVHFHLVFSQPSRLLMRAPNPSPCFLG